MMKYLLEENITHGTPSFPVCLYTVDNTAGYRQVLPCHWHEEYEIVCMSRGTAVFRIGDNSYEVREGQFIFVNSGELHSAYSTDEAGCCYHAVVFNLSFLNSNCSDVCQSRYVSPLMLRQYKFPHTIPGPLHVKKALETQIMQLITALDEKNAGYELFVKGSLFLILSLLISDGMLLEDGDNIVCPGRDKADKLKKVIEYISLHYFKKISIQELADLTGMSRYNFCRFFKGYTGMTPVEYLNLHRVNEACRLLQSGSCSVTDAALQTGFENMSYFARTFRKYKDTVPSKLKCRNF